MNDVLEYQRAYMLECQLPNGAFLLSPQSTVINPYFTNLALPALLDLKEVSAIRSYLEWFFTHVNSQGYINDYEVKDGKEIDTGKADSEDSYPTTFFSLLKLYMGKTNHIDWLLPYHGTLSRMLEAVLALQQKDGLTWAKHSYRVKYLMDNCEVAQGLQDVSSLFSLLGDREMAVLATKKAELCKEGIWNMYNPQKQSFAVYDNVYPTWTKWYADVTSQAFPIRYGIVDAKDELATLLYQQITRHFPKFDLFQTGDFFPWMSMGECALIMGDLSRSTRMVEMAQNVYVYGPQKKYWLLHEAGRFVRLQMALLRLAKS